MVFQPKRSLFLYPRGTVKHASKRKGNNMKITHVISDSNVGGAGILLSSLVEELKNDFDFEIILPVGSALSERLPSGVKITLLPTEPDKSFSARDVALFRNYFRENSTDIIHTHASLSARIGGKMAGIGRCISTRHCAYPDTAVKKMLLHKRLLYELSTDLTVSTADFSTENLLRSGVKKEKIVTIKNGSRDQSEKVKDSTFSLHAALGIPKEKKIVGCVGRLEKIKGQDLILRAAREVLKFFADTHFLFIGTGSQINEYKKLAASLGIDKSVTFTGYVSDPARYQKDFYINVISSRGTETSSLATSECMSLAVPSVVSSFGGNKEMVNHGRDGLIFNTDNIFSLSSAIMELLENEELHRSLSSGARKSYEEKFSSRRMAEDYKRLYLSL